MTVPFIIMYVFYRLAYLFSIASRRSSIDRVEVDIIKIVGNILPLTLFTLKNIRRFYSELMRTFKKGEKRLKT